MTKDKILESAYRLFSIYGYEGTSLSQIAKEVGIKKPSIYAHFTCKEEIFTTTLENNAKRLSLYLDRSLNEVKGKNTEIVLSYLLTRMTDYFVNCKSAKGFWSSILFFPPKFLREIIESKLSSLVLKVRISLEEIFEEGIRKGEIRERDINYLIYSYLCLLQGNYGTILYDNMNSNELSFLQMKEESWRIFWDGIKKN